MSLRDEIAEAIRTEAWRPGFTPEVAADVVLDLLRRRGERALSLPGHPGEWITEGGPPGGAVRWLVDLGER